MTQAKSLADVVHSTYTIEKRFSVSPETAFKAFSDPETKRRWFGQADGRPVEAFTMDFRPGGQDVARYRMPQGTPFPGAALGSITTYLDIVENRRLVFAYTMSLNDVTFSASLATVEFRAADGGTELTFTEQGAFFENADGPAMRQAGWRKLLASLEKEFAG